MSTARAPKQRITISNNATITATAPRLGWNRCRSFESTLLFTISSPAVTRWKVSESSSVDRDPCVGYVAVAASFVTCFQYAITIETCRTPNVTNTAVGLEENNDLRAGCGGCNESNACRPDSASLTIVRSVADRAPSGRLPCPRLAAGGNFVNLVAKTSCFVPIRAQIDENP